MGDLISREEVIDDILKLAKEPSVQRNPDSVNGLLGAYNIVYEKPSADIMDCARALKEHCNEHLRKPHTLCDDCPMFEGVCRRFNVVPRWWDLPEGESK